MSGPALILAVAAVAVMARGLHLVVAGRREGRRVEDAGLRTVASLRVVAGVKLLNRGALLLVVALALLFAL